MNRPAELSEIPVGTPDTLSGDIRFAGTRVQVRALLDTLMSTRSLAEFFVGFSGVTRPAYGVH